MGRSNRVEELESQVRELEATVTGLTDELLECKQRLGELEEVVGAVETTDDAIDGSLSSLLDEVDTYRVGEEESGAETEREGDGIIVA